MVTLIESTCSLLRDFSTELSEKSFLNFSISCVNLLQKNPTQTYILSLPSCSCYIVSTRLLTTTQRISLRECNVSSQSEKIRLTNTLIVPIVCEIREKISLIAL